MIIYLITNLINNKQYVGQTIKTMELRWKRHCWYSEHTKKTPISLAILKYGKENFKIEKIYECDNLEDLNEKELYFAKLYKTFSPNGYNLKAGNGRGSMSEDTKKKISKANKGKKHSDETKRRLSESHKGHKVSEQTKQKLSKINKGKRGSDLCYQRASEVSAKEYDFISPDGEKVHIINMKKFCTINNLSPSKMCLVNKSKRNHHKGWKKNNE